MTRQIPISALNQRGEGIAGIVAMIILFAVTVKIGLAIVPHQLDDRALSELMGSEVRKANSSKLPIEKVFKGFRKQLTINGFYDVDAKEMYQVVNNTPGAIKLKKSYIKESVLFPGIYITNKFEGDVEEVSPE